MKRPAPSTLHRRPPRAGPCAYAAITALVLPLAVSADYLDDIGYTALAARPGISLPDGAAIRIDQVEASTGNDPESPVYRPDPASPAFTGVTFIDQTAGPNPASCRFSRFSRRRWSNSN